MHGDSITVQVAECKERCALIGIADIGPLGIEDDHDVRVLIADVADNILERLDAFRPVRLKEGGVRLVRTDQILSSIDDADQVLREGDLGTRKFSRTLPAERLDLRDVRIEADADEFAVVPLTLQSIIKPSHDGPLSLVGTEGDYKISR